MRLFQRLFAGSRITAAFGLSRTTRGKSDVTIKHDIRRTTRGKSNVAIKHDIQPVAC